jgi:hypothetical protein
LPITLKIDSELKEEYYAYEVPDSDTLHEYVARMQSTFLKFAKENLISVPEAISDPIILGRIAVRVDQRCEYYRIYHENTYLSEIRKMALLAYWIIKYRPFQIKMRDASKWQNRLKVNESIAFRMMLGMVIKIITQNQNRTIDVPSDYKQKILHAFREHDLTKESVMLVAESLLQQVS